METTQDLSSIFQHEVLTPDLYAALKQLAFATRESLDRFLNLLGSVEQRVNAGELKAEAQALKLGLCYLALGRYDEAIGWLERAGRSAEKSFFLGRALMDRRRYREAVGHFEEAARQGRDELECDCLRAECLLGAGEEDAAARLLEGWAAAGRESAQWQYARARLAEQRGELDEAIEHLDAAVALDDDHAWALFRLAYLLDLHGADELALDMYETCAALPFVHTDALLNLAIIYEDVGAYEKAAACLRRILAVNPNHSRAVLYLKDVLAAHDMYIDEHVVKEQEREDAVLGIQVTDFELSVRSRNCLKKMNIHTLGDLLRISQTDLLAYKNFGETSLREIRAMLSQKGLELGQYAIKPAETAAGAEQGPAVPEGNPEVLARSVAALELSVRARKCLQRLGVNTVGELVAKTEAQLLETRNFGQTSLSEIKSRLAEMGLMLRLTS